MRLEILSYNNPEALQKAVHLIYKGHPVGVFNRGVCAIVGMGENRLFFERVSKIKGEGRQGRPLATFMHSENFVKYIDLTKVKDVLRDILSNPNELKSRFGSLCFIRAPLVPSASVYFPKYVTSYSDDRTLIGQNWDPSGHAPAEALLKFMHEAGISFPALTSLNVSGQPEIVSQEEGIEFCRVRGIPLFLKDENANPLVKGSYTIFAVNHEGVHLMRDGHIPWWCFEKIWPIPINTANAKSTHYPQMKIDKKTMDNLHHPHDVRIALIYHLSGATKQIDDNTLIKKQDKNVLHSFWPWKAIRQFLKLKRRLNLFGNFKK